jgi:prefoldin subunit 5
MLTAVVIINLLISGVCFYIAAKVWKIRRTIARLEIRIAKMERCSSNVLSTSPDFLGKRQQGTRQLRRRYQQLELQLQQVQQLLGLLGFGRMLWSRRDRRLR